MPVSPPRARAFLTTVVTGAAAAGATLWVAGRWDRPSPPPAVAAAAAPA
jgi:hypothetical protein